MVAMARSDFYASPFGIAYSTYMERPRLSRAIGLAVWGGDSKQYYESMGAVAEVADGGTIVDCPCGAGPALRALAPNAAVRYVAVDFSPAMLRRAKARAKARGLSDVEFVEGSAMAIPMPSASADLFLSLWGLHCFEDPAAAMTEVARVLKPGGRLVGTALVRGNDHLRQRVLIRPHRGDFGQVGSEPQIREWFGNAGFRLSSAKRSGPMLFFDADLGPEAP
jgi:ubiquinone/menaquinone biosynthesis C-methylase UbiE